MKKDKHLIGYCGLYCGACSFKVAFDENNREHLIAMPAKYDRHKEAELQFCPGCKQEDKPGECAIRDCARDKNMDHCGHCPGFPCEKLELFCNDGTPHHTDTIRNLQQLRKMGEEMWLAIQAQKWTCPCGAKLSWYMQNCRSCGAGQ